MREWKAGDLRDWLYWNDISKEHFAISTGVTTRTVERWLKKTKLPGPVQAYLNSCVAQIRMEATVREAKEEGLLPWWVR